VASLRLKLAVAAGALVGVCAVAGFGPVVRLAASRAAERRGAVVTVDRVVPCWLGVRLLGVDVRLQGVSTAQMSVEEVDVRWGAGGRKVVVRGGAVRAVGAREVVAGEVERWRSLRAAADRPDGGSAAGGGELELAGLAVSWQSSASSPSESVSAQDVRFERGDDRVAASADEATIVFGRLRLRATRGRVELGRADGHGAYRLRGLLADAVDAEVVLDAALQAAPGAATAASFAPVLSVGAAPAGAPAIVGVGEGSGAATGAERVRAALMRSASVLDALLDPVAKVELAGVRARVRRGDDTLNLGPGTFRARREDGRLVFELSPGAVSEHALTFRLAVPLGREGEGAVVADVDGGPIGLSALGVHEGDFGLLDVGRAAVVTRSHLVLSGDGRRLAIDGEGKVHGLSIRNAALSEEPVRGLELAWRLKGEAALDGSFARIDDGEVDLGAVRVKARGTVERSGNGARRIVGDFEVPLTACQSMLDSVPKGLVPKLSGMRMAGSFGLRGAGNIDTGRLDRGFHLDWDVANSCRITEAPPEVSVDRFSRPFTHTAYGPNGERIEVESGPGTPGWAPLAGTSKFMEVAVLTTEDGAFHRHHGFDEEAIRNSIRENLRSGRFVRGASTISMQLAKNLYLDRTKNLARKLQEAVLTMYLEQELTKDQILELYLNVVEFGPMVYGVGPAARHYFSSSAQDLSLAQALYLSSVLPNPKAQHFGAGGAVAAGWSRYLRKLMRVAHARKRISDDELEEGLRESVVRGSPAPRRDERGAETAGDEPGAPEPGTDATE
jgi:hypothetical protein